MIFQSRFIGFNEAIVSNISAASLMDPPQWSGSDLRTTERIVSGHRPPERELANSRAGPMVFR